MADAVLQVEARLKDNVTKQLGTVATKAKAFGEQVRGAFGGMGKGALQVAAGFSLAQIGMKAASMAINAMRQSFDFMVESTNKFESQMSRVRAILQPTGDDFNKLGDKAKALGESTVFTANEAASAFVEMGKLGLKTNEILAASSGVLNLAAIAQTSMSEASKATIETLNQFSLSADQSNRVVDVMAKSFTSSALDMQKFTDSMSYVGPIAGSLNVSLENTAGALSILADQGIVGSMAGTGLRFTLSQLYTESSKVGRMIGVTANDTRTLGERLAAVDKLGLSAGQMMEIFGQRAGVAANVLVKHREKVDEMTESYKNATGTGNKMADDMLNNVEGRTLLLKSAQEGFAIAWGESFSDQKIKRLEWYAAMWSRATQWVKAHKEEMKTMGNIISGAITGVIWLGKTTMQVIATTLDTVSLMITSIPELFWNAVYASGKALNWLSQKVLKKDFFDLTGAQRNLTAWREVNQETVDNIFATWNKNADFSGAYNDGVKEATDALGKNTDALDESFSSLEKESAATIALRAHIESLKNEIDGLNKSMSISTKDTDAVAEARSRMLAAVADMEKQFKVDRLGLFASDADIMKIQQAAELDQLDAKHEEELAKLDEHSKARLEIEAAHQSERDAMTLAHERMRRDVIIQNAKSGVDASLSALKEMTNGNKKYIALYKTAAIAQATMDTYASAVAAFKSMASIPYVGPALGVAAAGVAVASGLVNIGKIASAKFARGGDFVTNGPRTITVGDNPGGRERVSIEPLSSTNFNGPQGGNALTMGDTNIVVNGAGNPMETGRRVEYALADHRRQLEKMFRNGVINPSRLGLVRA